MRCRFAASAAVLMAAFCSVTQAQSVLKVDFTRDGLPVPHWKLSLDAGGKGLYESWPAQGAPVSRVFQLQPETWTKLQELLTASKGMVPCETKSKGLAHVGQKAVSYAPPGAAAVECSFNYTDNKPLQQANELWMGVAATLEEARRIESLHKHDRLGLDKELADYEHALSMQMAAEPNLIAPELQSLIEDPMLMERVRQRALRILQSKKN